MEIPSLGDSLEADFIQKNVQARNHRRKLIVFILLGIILLMSFGAIAFFFMQQKTEEEQNINSVINKFSFSTLQTFNVSSCRKMAVCKLGALDCDINGSTLNLIDERDGKSYRIRKFEDGNCWMIDDLTYGGGVDGASDYCSNKITTLNSDSWRDATFSANVIPISTSGLNDNADAIDPLWYGDCSNHGSNEEYCNSEGIKCGYFYNWAAAIQDKEAFNGSLKEMIEPVQGICPDGWVLPPAEGNGSFLNLHQALGYSWNASLGEGDGQIGFWQSSSQWNAVFNGSIFESEGVLDVGHSGAYWTSTKQSREAAYAAIFTAEKSFLNAYINKNDGLSIRCVLLDNNVQ